ncbi:hypothetical protein LBMAG42_21490 [Deltaproteobacteria bacterium]|nr:hypothetical protein LBMAG42_21490 [Deltaproteobacteria bacterium]
MGQDGALAALNPAAGASTWMMLAVVGAKGGCGTSLLAANLAAELAATRSVCLVDLQFSKGDLAGCLNLAPTHCVRDVLGPDVRLDAAAVRGSVEAHSSGLDVLTQPYDLVDLIRVDAGEVDRLLGVTSQAWSVVVADCGSGIEEALLTAMRRATFVLLVVTPTIPALRDAVRTLGLLKDLGVPQSRVRLALNRWQSGLSLDQADIEEQLAMTSFVTFAEDLHACVAAEERGALLSEAAPRSRLTRDVRAAATRVLAELDQLAPSLRSL